MMYIIVCLLFLRHSGQVSRFSALEHRRFDAHTVVYRARGRASGHEEVTCTILGLI